MGGVGGIKPLCSQSLERASRDQEIQQAPGSNWPDDVAIPSGEHCDFGDASLGDAGSAWRVGTKAAGRLLDGVTHDGFPRSAP